VPAEAAPLSVTVVPLPIDAGEIVPEMLNLLPADPAGRISQMLKL
jgi:hypothetical protein